MEKFYTMKDACVILGVHPNTLRRWDKEEKIRCVRTPGNRRRIPESEILRIIGGPGLPPALKTEVEKVMKPETIPPKEPIPKLDKEKITPAELPRHAVLDKLAPAGLAQRTVFGDLLSTVLVLQTFTLEELAARAHCPEAVARTFCERMCTHSYLAGKNGGFELRVRVVR
jgi:excisionase family DNA binding protein